ncbi:hypothetical protein A9E74_01685 [Methylophaga muralis]|uniref:Uncharacterized protein n=1 Tax=Methylophaga muralis TaxID=291169 RepID=A0A1E3GRE6_9GAMM|nr:hypothetical protein A9E74_01685 [Methylophaga muralis]
MLDLPSDHFSVTAVLLKKASQHRWAKHSWSLLGVMPGLSEAKLSDAQTQGELLLFPDLHLRLFRHYCESYYVNLMSEQAKIYFIGRLENDSLTPVLLTVDFDEAASYMELVIKCLMRPCRMSCVSGWNGFCFIITPHKLQRNAVVNAGKTTKEAHDERKIGIREFLITMVSA